MGHDLTPNSISREGPPGGVAPSDWVPLYQDLVWPAFILAVVVLFQRPLRRTLGPLLEAIGNRIGSGADVSIGKGGFSLTGGPKLEAPVAAGAGGPPAPPSEESAGAAGEDAPRRRGGRKRRPGRAREAEAFALEPAEEGPQSAAQSVAQSAAPAAQAAFAAEEAPASSEAAHPDLYLVHKARRMGGTRDSPLHEIVIALDADDGADLDRIEKVVYHLHHTFRRPRREVASRSDNFALRLENVWGQFMVYADVHFRDGSAPVQLTRYLNF
jgi:hypothetical protein